MLAVVYIVALKTHIIIPQEWIMSLTQETLNNIGKASYQNRRIFWSNTNVDDDGIPDVTIKPNFQRNIASTFPPDSDDACYIGRVKWYCETVARAKYFRDTFRPQLPVVYSPRKRHEKSLPSLPPCSQNTNRSGPIVHRETNVISTESEPQIEPIAAQSIGQHKSHVRNLWPIEEERQPVLEESPVESLSVDSEMNSAVDEKLTMPNIEMDEIDSFAISDYFSDEQNNQESTIEDRAVAVTVNIGDGCEMVFPIGVKLKPKIDEYQTKKNDPISVNIPFKQNPNGDRAYLIKGSKEIALPAIVVKGLIQLNGEQNRQNEQFDKNFIKALLVGLIGINKIKYHGVDPNVAKFIEDLFQCRIKDAKEYEKRCSSFKELLNSAESEILKTSFTR
ncbi:uncharacterized protein LOC129579588 [Sitodiplosis mosellana]|uniref:uncharacterized protein LOC129579588 n=1 Tax=Sitodiplosis mosellana TaxID=263140 RepID=UPI0024446AE9|nr:uncharacterized protein LOC129579588 [Sitodiplosis mosellana]